MEQHDKRWHGGNPCPDRATAVDTGRFLDSIVIGSSALLASDNDNSNSLYVVGPQILHIVHELSPATENGILILKIYPSHSQSRAKQYPKGNNKKLSQTRISKIRRCTIHLSSDTHQIVIE